MALKCPRCGQGIDQDFGMVPCPKCGTVLSIDFDGNISVADHGSEAVPQESSPQILQDQNFENEGPSLEPEPPPPAGDFLTFEEPEIQSPLDLSQTQPPPRLEDGSITKSPDQMNIETVFHQVPQAEMGFDPQAEAAALESADANEAPTQALSLSEEISQFAEKDSAEGLLSYTLIVKGIDTINIRQAILQALSDSRFGFGQRNLQKDIKMGVLKLPNLNPGQMVMAVRKLRALPVDISWSQNGI